MNARFDRSELGLGRLAAALGRRLADLPQAAAWRWSDAARHNRLALAALRNRHRGQRAFIMGNGPSLARMDLRPLADEITFGMNRIYLLFDELPFQPSYYVSINELVLEQFTSEIAALSMPKFLNWNARDHFDASGDLYYLRMHLGLADRFESDARQPLSSGGTVTYAAMQLAFFMGFEQVILIGVDHRFAAQGTPNQAETRQGADRDHFHPDYFPPGSRWQLPDLRRSELAYELARQAFEADGRQVLDATLEGALTVFDKVKFEELF